MTSLRSHLRPLLALIALTPLADAQQGFQPGREAMWWAPTAEDWRKPCLITFQRTWDDAVAVSTQTGKPILACVNMDGEIASEHYAGVRYRMPEIAALYEPYVCVIASVYRHTPRDYDEEGNRVLCPRFGSTTCGEHITMEPLLYEKFLDGERIAPRHIMVELDGAETYDIYYAFDTDSVFRTIVAGIEDRLETPIADVPPLTLEEQVISPNIADRLAVEEAYQGGDRETRRVLLRAAVAGGEAANVDLLRLAVFDLDVEMNRLALIALADADSEKAVGLIAEALRVPMEQADRDALIAALERLGASFPHARTLAAVHRGLAARSDAVDVDGWAAALAEAEAPTQPVDRLVLEYQLENKARLTRNSPEDGRALIDYAEATLAMAVDPGTAVVLASDPRTSSKYAALMFEDVRQAALRAEDLGQAGWRTDVVIAVSAYYLGELAEAHARAEAAVDDIPSGEDSWSAMAAFAIFAEARSEVITRAVKAGEEWPSEWLTDVDAAYAVLARHPLGTDDQVVAHLDFLTRLGAGARADGVLQRGLERFPDSWQLHARLRGRTLWAKGVAGLEQAYTGMLASPQATPNTTWFAGYASLVAAEFLRRRGQNEEALGAYDRGIALYERYIAEEPGERGTADHYVALALAGQARIFLERQSWELAVNHLVAAFERRPEAASNMDGLGFSAVVTARTLQARLTENELADLAERVQAGLDALDSDMLFPPAFERRGPAPEARRRIRELERRGGADLIPTNDK